MESRRDIGGFEPVAEKSGPCRHRPWGAVNCSDVVVAAGLEGTQRSRAGQQGDKLMAMRRKSTRSGMVFGPDIDERRKQMRTSFPHTQYHQ